MPLLDCLLPVSGKETYLEECIESVLAQSFKDFQLLIFDDATSESSKALIQKYQKKDPRIKIFSTKESVGIPAALNILIKKTKSKYTAMQLPFDSSHEKRFEKQMDRMKNSTLVALGSSIIWDGTLVGKEKVEILCTENPKEVLAAQIYSEEMKGLFLETAIYQKAALKESAPLNSKLPYGYDLELHARMQKKFPARIANLKEPLYTMRIFHGCIQEKVQLGEVHIDKEKIYQLNMPLLYSVKKRYFDNILMTNGYAPY